MDKEQEAIYSYIRDYKDLSINQLRALYQEAAELTPRQDQDPCLQAALLQLMEQMDPAPQGNSAADLAQFLICNPMPRGSARSSRSRPRMRPLLVAAIIAISLAIAAGAYSACTFFFSLEGEIGTGAKAGVMKLDAPGENGYTTLEEMLADNGLDAVGPEWMPEGYSLRTLELRPENHDTQMVFAAWYAQGQKEDGIKLVVTHFLQGVPDSYMSAYEKDEGYHASELPNGAAYYTYQNREISGAVWELVGENAVCSIFGPITEQEMKQIVNSICTEEADYETH